MLALADRLGASALATGHYARVVDDGEGPLLRRRRRRGQGPDLHALRRCGPRRSRGCASRSRTLRSPGCGSSPPPRACRWPPSARARTCASSPARASARSSPAHGGPRGRPGEIVDSRGTRHRPPLRPSQLHGRPATRASASAAASRSTCWRPTRATNRVVVGAHEELARSACRRPRRPPPPARRARGPREAPLPLAADRLRRRAARPAATTSSSSSSPSRPMAWRPGRPPACMDGAWSSGHATIAS